MLIQRKSTTYLSELSEFNISFLFNLENKTFKVNSGYLFSLKQFIKKKVEGYKFFYLKTQHSFHLVDPSPWPVLSSFGGLFITTGGVLYMQGFIGGKFLFFLGLITIFYVMWVWWRDIIRESTLEECHSFSVQKGLRLGVFLFIVSEIMFFLGFFWAFFHSSLAPAYSLGGVWPPFFIMPINTLGIPLTNTLFLLSSGATVTWAHHAIVVRAKKQAVLGLFMTLLLAVIFSGLQFLEYCEAPFNLSDGIFGSCFYLATGFHGIHVLIGTIALFVSTVRVILNHFTNSHHFGFEAAAWYWHMVDLVWLFLFVSIYWWGGA